MKKIFLICPDFYDYKKIIIHALKKKGVHVTCINERPRRWVYSFIKRILPMCFADFFYYYYFFYYKNISQYSDYDFILIRGEVLSERVLKKFRMLSQTKWVMYQWDSDLVCNFHDKIKYFDCVKSFDPVDCQKFKIELLPLFYLNKYEEFSLIPSFDIGYVGSYNHDRYSKLKLILTKLEKNGLSYRIHFYISVFDYIKNKILGHNISLKHISFSKLSREDYVRLMSQSKAILDLENIKQTGLTMRTIETLASGRLLVTTNPSISMFSEKIKNYILLDPNLITNSDMMSIKSYNSHRPHASIGKYHIDNWIENLLLK